MDRKRYGSLERGSMPPIIAPALIMSPVAQRCEAVLGSLSIFDKLRKDEVGRITRLFQTTLLKEGEIHSQGASHDDARLFVVVSGLVDIEVTHPYGVHGSRLEPGDRYGDVGLLTGVTRPLKLIAKEDTRLLTLDRAGLGAVLAEFPAVALPLATELATEVRMKNDVLRELLEVHAESLSGDQRRAAILGRKRALALRGARVTRLSPRALFRALVAQQGGEPPFWMLTGFIVSMSLARLVVALILKFKLEKQLFALVPGTDPNPMHVHHFNYGLILIGVSGLAALSPLGRRALRSLAFAFGFGCGLVFDEFALFWNLNPEYAQGLSLVAAAIMASVLVQLTYFRNFWAALVRRLYYAAGGRR
jgi:CRP-like cAMP-binding protein